jgi:hypothetical protein
MFLRPVRRSFYFFSPPSRSRSRSASPQRALHAELGVVAHGADELVGPRPEGRLAGLDLARAEDRRAAEIAAVLLDVEVVGQRPVVAEREPDDGGLGRPAVHGHLLRLERVLVRAEGDRLVAADGHSVLLLAAVALLALVATPAAAQHRQAHHDGWEGLEHGGG